VILAAVFAALAWLVIFVVRQARREEPTRDRPVASPIADETANTSTQTGTETIHAAEPPGPQEPPPEPRTPPARVKPSPRARSRSPDRALRALEMHDAKLPPVRLDPVRGRLDRTSIEIRVPNQDGRGLSEEQIRRVVSARTRDVASCNLAGHDEISLKVGFDMKVQPDGRVGDVQPGTDSDRLAPGVTRCIVTKMRGWLFPSFERSTPLDVQLAFVLIPPLAGAGSEGSAQPGPR
jgi:hypothetical protein